MLTQKEYENRKGTECPYGRKADIGSGRCMNCKFFHIFEGYCSGDTESVQKHMRLLNLGY